VEPQPESAMRASATQCAGTRCWITALNIPGTVDVDSDWCDLPSRSACLHAETRRELLTAKKIPVRLTCGANRCDATVASTCGVMLSHLAGACSGVRPARRLGSHRGNRAQVLVRPGSLRWEGVPLQLLQWPRRAGFAPDRA
jgi:hypothetical protein